MEEEYKAGRHLADALETTEGNLMFLRDGGLLHPYNSPVLKTYPEDAKEDAGKGLYYWALARESYIGFTYNKIFCPKRRCRKTLMVFSIPSSKEKWASASVRQQALRSSVQ
jgi:hypothetical protein